MSSGHHKQGNSRKPGDWARIMNGRKNKSRYTRELMRCPSGRHIISVSTILNHFCGPIVKRGWHP